STCLTPGWMDDIVRPRLSYGGVRHPTCLMAVRMRFGPNCKRPASAPPARFRAARLALAALVLVVPATGSGQDALPGGAADSSDITGSVALPLPGQQEVLPAVSEPFKAGESLRFSVQYGGISAGSAYLEVPQLAEWNGSPAYTLVARA